MANLPPPNVHPMDAPYIDSQYPNESRPVQTFDRIETYQPLAKQDPNQDLLKTLIQNQQLMQQQLMQQQLMQQQQLLNQQPNINMANAKINYGTNIENAKVNTGTQNKQNQKIQSGVSGNAISSDNKNVNNLGHQIGGNNYGNINQEVTNNNQTIIFQETVTVPPPKEGKPFPLWLAIIVLILNLIWPGTGTLIASCTIHNGNLRGHFFCAGMWQLFLALILIGWCYGIYTSCFFLSAAMAGNDLYDFYRSNHSGSVLY